MSWISTAGSKQIHSWAYDAIEGTLDTKFLCQKCKNGEGVHACPTCKASGASSHYRYHDVPVTVWDQLRSAESKGGAFNSLVKRGEYVDPPAPFKFTRVR